jgi:histidine kinase/histidine kinase/DNA gyrase B/HSP90-like ATPase
MHLGLRLPDFLGRRGRPPSTQAISLGSLSRGGLIAAAIVFALSTQFLFQLDMYDVWPLPDILRGWLEYFLDLATAGGCAFAAFALAASLRPVTGVPGHALLIGSIVLGALAGEAFLLVRSPLPSDVSIAAVLFAKVARWAAFGGLGYAVYIYRRRAAEAATRAHESELHRVQLERQMNEARLQTMRAQIEPHFLFNTLANVQRLYQTDRGRGRRMLANFVAYLRAALPEMRRDETTLNQEVELARAYLNVLQVRMGNRLRFRVDVPGELGALLFPPLALSTLAENAIKHGLNPLPEGGSIEIRARIENLQLKVEVADTGAGLTQSGGSGTGLANLRARLAALYGEGASLAVEANAPRGIRATIAVPANRVPAAQG